MVDWYSDLKKGLDDLQETLERINKSENKSLDLLRSGVINKYHHINKLYRHFICDNDNVSLDFLLERRSLSAKHEEITNAYHNLFQKQFYDIDPCGGDIIANMDQYYEVKSPIFFIQDIADEVQQFYENTESVFPNFLVAEKEYPNYEGDEFVATYEFYDSNTNWDATGMHQIYHSIKKMYSIFEVVASYKNKLLGSYSMDISHVYDALLKEFKQYSKTNEIPTFRVLCKLAQRFKHSRNLPLSADIWAEVMSVEDEMLNSVIKGQSSSEDSRMNDFYDKYTILDLSLNYALVQKVLDISVDGSLFDFEYAFEPNVKLLYFLNEDNYELFFQLVLRRNLIQCEMFPELKAEYREFVNGEAKEDEDKEHSNNAQVKIDEVNPTPFVIRSEQSEEVIAYIKELMASKTNPKDILKPLRAAQDAGVIRKPTWEEFNNAFPNSGVRSKSSLTNYTKIDATPYKDDNSFTEMVAEFKKRFLPD